MAGFLSAAIAAVGSSSIGSALVRILVAYGVSRLINGATGKDNNQQVDQGIRLQLQPDTTNPIPLLYGSAYYGGNITDAQLTNDNQVMWTCLTLSEVDPLATVFNSDPLGGLNDVPVKTNIDEVYWNNQRVTFQADGVTIDYVTNPDGTVDKSPSGLVQIYLYEKSSATPIFPSGVSGTATLVDARTLFPGWTMPTVGAPDSQAMTNLTFAIVKMTYNRDKGITGLPALKFKVSNNIYKPGSALYHYMRNRISGAGLPTSQIDSNSLVALNAYSTQAVDFYNEDTGAVETLGNRYQINGIINPQKSVFENINAMANAAGAFVNYDIAKGKWGVKINRDASPVLHFDDSNIISGIDLTGTSLDNQYNGIELEFPSRFLQDQYDTIKLELPQEYRNANEPDNVLKVRYELLNESVQARELAYLELYQNRADRIITFTTDYSKINVEAGDVITVTNSIYGFDNQQFRVVRVREIESEQGGLAVEITAQEYDSTIYTAGGQPRRPRTPTQALGIPSIGAIGKPATPTVVTANNNAQPSVLITATVPYGIVDRMEFWYSNDNWATSTLLWTEKNTNGAPFATGNTIMFRTPNLVLGEYSFKVRAGNETVFGEYSDASAILLWEPVQTTDQVTENTTFSWTDELLPILGAGAIAYFAYKALYPDLVKALSQTDLGKLLGIEDPEAIAAAQAALEAQSAAFRIVNAGGVSFSAGVDDTLTFVAGDGIRIDAVDVGHEIIISTGRGLINENDFSKDYNSLDANGSRKYLDDCKAVRYWPTKHTVIPAEPVKALVITGASTFYDECYKTTVPVIVSPNLWEIGIKVGETKIISEDAIGYSMAWTDDSPNKALRTLRVRRVTTDKYVVLKWWRADPGGDLPVPLNVDQCNLEPDSRPLFPTTDYPNYNTMIGYEFASYDDLSAVLGSNEEGLILVNKDGVPERAITYTPKPEIYVFARMCFNHDGKEPQIDFND